MLIRRQQMLITGVSLLLVGALAWVLFDALRDTRREVERNRLAADLIVRGTSGLRLVAFEYAQRSSARARRQWWMRHASLGDMLASELFADTSQQQLIDRLRGLHRELADAFRIFSEPASAAAAPAVPIGGFDLRAQNAAHIILLTDDMAAESRRLLRASQNSLDAAQGQLRALALGLIALVLSLLAMHAYLQRRQVLAPAARLQRAAEALGEGDLTARVGACRDDELGRLAAAFDGMAARLQQSISALGLSRRQLEAANQELESFSYSVSHDLRAPLRGIDGWSLALIEDYSAQLDATALQYLSRVRLETQRMGRLIDDLLELSRTGRANMTISEVDLSALAELIAARLVQASPQRRMQFLIRPGLRADGDQRLLEIVLTNLLDNACKFSGTRPEAVIEFAQGEVLAPGSQTAESAFFVRDNGVGFDLAHAEHLFGAFQRMHKQSEFPGTGVGLATVERIVHRHGGRVWAESAPDRGACFYFTVPGSMVIGHTDPATPTP